MLLGTFHYEILFQEYGLSLSSIASRSDLRFELERPVHQGTAPQTLVKVTRIQGPRRDPRQAFRRVNFIDYPKDRVLRRGGSECVALS